MTVIPVAAVLFVIAVAVMDAAADTPADDPARPATRPASTQPVAPNLPDRIPLTGVLRGGIMAIGGEHTGWQLEPATGEPIEVIPPTTQPERLAELDGKPVLVTGRWIEKNYVERGKTRVFQILEIRPIE